MKLQIDTSDAPLETPLRGRLVECPPGMPVHVTSTLTDEAGEPWTAQATFWPDHSTTIDLAQSPSIAGTFRGTDAHGLFWSGEPPGTASRLEDILAGRAGGSLMAQLGPLDPLVFNITATSDRSASPVKAHVTRRRLMPDVRKSAPPAPLAGALFEPAQPNGAGVIVLGGSEGGLFPARAALLAASGFTTLALAYFDHPGVSATARDLPLEYFRDALEWMRGRDGLSRIGLIGVSRGSEGAQLTAIAWPELVDALICWVPSHMINQGLDLSHGDDFITERSAMWAKEDAPIRGVAFTEADKAANTDRNGDFARPSGRRYREDFERAWTQPGAEAFRIPIERYGGPVLAIGGREDALWPSDLGAEAIAEAARNSNRASEARVYANAGHLIGTPNEPRPFPYVMHWTEGFMGIENGFCAYGGTREGAALAARQSWAAQTRFLQVHLCD